MKRAQDILIEHLNKDGVNYNMAHGDTWIDDGDVFSTFLNAMKEYALEAIKEDRKNVVEEASVDFFLEEDTCCHSVDRMSIINTALPKLI